MPLVQSQTAQVPSLFSPLSSYELLGKLLNDLLAQCLHLYKKECT